jgi:hypothetical protein
MPRELLVKQAKSSANFSGIGIFNDQRCQDFLTSGNMDRLTGWISDHVLKEPQVEIKTPEVISIIQKAVDYVSASLAGVTEQNLDEVFPDNSAFD